MCNISVTNARPNQDRIQENYFFWPYGKAKQASKTKSGNQLTLTGIALNIPAWFHGSSLAFRCESLFPRPS